MIRIYLTLTYFFAIIVLKIRNLKIFETWRNIRWIKSV